MANHKITTGLAQRSTSHIENLSRCVVQIDGRVAYAPLFYMGGTLGFDVDGNPPSISIVDDHEQYFRTESVELVLRHIDLFCEACATALMAGAAAYYGFADLTTLIRGRTQ